MLGLAEFLHGLKLRLKAPEKRALTYLILSLDENCPEQQIAYAAEQRVWLGCAYADQIIALNDGLNAEHRLCCAEAAKRYGVVFCAANEVTRFLP